MVNKSAFIVFQMLMNVLKKFITVTMKLIDNVTIP